MGEQYFSKGYIPIYSKPIKEEIEKYITSTTKHGF